MSQTLNKTSDDIFNKIFTNKELFLIFLQKYIKLPFVNEVTIDNLIIEDTLLVDLQDHNRRTDILYQIKVNNKEMFVFLLLEHQSSVNYLMPFRMLEYTVKIYRRFIDKIDTIANEKIC